MEHLEDALKDPSKTIILHQLANDLNKEPLRTINLNYIENLSETLDLDPFYIYKYLQYRIKEYLVQKENKLPVEKTKALRTALHIIDLHLKKPSLDTQDNVASDILLKGEQTIFCPNCNKQIIPVGYFCSQCGYQIRKITMSDSGYL
jgi:hypothetical protein